MQGFGNAGYHFARLAHEAGFRIVAISDSQGAILSMAGLDPEMIWTHKRARHELKSMLYCDATVCEEAEHTTLSNQELLELEVDVLVLAAMENQITVENAERVVAHQILEIANGPTSAEADAILCDKGITVLPDVQCNSGGVTASYFEWVQHRAGMYWDEAEVNERLKRIIDRESLYIFDLAENKKVSLRAAAYLHGVERIAGAITEQGTQEYFSNQT